MVMGDSGMRNDNGGSEVVVDHEVVGLLVLSDSDILY